MFKPKYLGSRTLVIPNRDDRGNKCSSCRGYFLQHTMKYGVSSETPLSTPEFYCSECSKLLHLMEVTIK